MRSRADLRTEDLVVVCVRSSLRCCVLSRPAEKEFGCFGSRVRDLERDLTELRDGIRGEWRTVAGGGGQVLPLGVVGTVALAAALNELLGVVLTRASAESHGMVLGTVRAALVDVGCDRGISNEGHFLALSVVLSVVL